MNSIKKEKVKEKEECKNRNVKEQKNLKTVGAVRERERERVTI